MPKHYQRRQQNRRLLEEARARNAAKRELPDSGIRLRDRNHVRGIKLDEGVFDLIEESMDAYSRIAHMLGRTQEVARQEVTKLNVSDTVAAVRQAPRIVGKAILDLSGTERYIELDAAVAAESGEATELARERLIKDARSPDVGFALIVVSRDPELPYETRMSRANRIAKLEATAGRIAVPALILGLPHVPELAEPSLSAVPDLHPQQADGRDIAG